MMSVRAAWLMERRTGIGSSDAAAICGMDPWKTALDVYNDKLGLAPQRESPEMQWGHLLEDVVAAAYTETTGRLLTLSGDSTSVHRAYPWMLATPDRLCVHERRVVEIKTARVAGDEWGEPGTDEVPRHYAIQVQHQLEVLDMPVCDVAVLIGGSDFRIYTLHRDHKLIASLISIEIDFWRLVQQRTPPPPDWEHPATPAAIECLHRPNEAIAIDLDDAAVPLAYEWDRLGEEARAAERQRDEIKGRLIEMLGDAGEGRLSDGRRIVRKITQREESVVRAHERVDFRILKARKK